MIKRLVFGLFLAALVLAGGAQAVPQLAATPTIAQLQANPIAASAALGLGTAAIVNTGTSGHTLPFLDQSVTFSGSLVTFSNNVVVNGTINGITVGTIADVTNTVIGSGAGSALTTGSNENTALGYYALHANTTATNSTAIGWNALYQNTGHANVALGGNAGCTVTTGFDNNFLGTGAGCSQAGDGIVTGADNSSLGTHTFAHLSGGSYNLALGNESMVGCADWVPTCDPLTGNGNSGAGNYTLQNIRGTANLNAAFAYMAGSACTYCARNIYIGPNSGAVTQTIGTDNILVGAFTDTTAANTSGAIVIGKNAKGGGLDTIVGTGAAASLTGDGQHIDAFGNGVMALATTGAINNAGFASGSLASLTTGSDNVCGGRQSCGAITTQGGNACWGWQCLQNAVSYSNSALGNQAGKTVTTGNGTFIGNGVGSVTTLTAANILLIGTSNAVDDPSNISNYINVQNVWTATGTDVPSTSTTTIAGNLLVSGTLKVGVYTGTTCTNAGYIAVNDNGGTARKLMVCS